MRYACVLFQPLGGVPHSGGIYHEGWVWKLWQGLKRHSNSDPELVVITDVDGVDPMAEMSEGGIKVERFNYRERDWSSMMEMLRPEVVGPEGCLMLGLDTVITGNLGPIEDLCAQYESIAPYDPYHKPNICNAAVWVTAYRAAELWGMFKGHRDEALDAQRYRFMGQFSEMFWLRRHLDPAGIWDVLLPGAIQSWKVDLGMQAPREDTKMVYFHGRQKPHLMDDEWLKENWG